ncbi:hypothetical protein Ahy_A05g022033 [Arachis hypogaea]|uniref:Pre-mRNA cleavage factor Im 25 kDa subunit n=1 Tax=Arachis hypogaea TaxID=3818 RepID=A0A445CZD2_ARAHY|nr:hypothetical protein Ahy_A05g022033 [Arachis hypogaea]
MPIVNLYSLSHYNFGAKETKVEKDTSVPARFARLRQIYEKEGMRISVAGVLLVQEHNYPHLLLLEIGGTFNKLPGGRLKPGENGRILNFHLFSMINYLIIGVLGYPNLLFVLLFFNLTEIEGLKRKLTSKLGPRLQNLVPNWKIGECVARWWRPNFEKFMYPHCPAHIKKPKECRVLYMVHLSDSGDFEVPENLKLLAVPMFELYDNAQRYGPVISSIPEQISRFEFRMNN